MIKFILLLVLLLSCNSSDDLKYNLPAVKDFNENEIEMPDIMITKEGVPIVRATSNKLVKNRTSDATLKGEVKADFFNDKGEHMSRLISDAADINQRTNNLYAYGNVKVVSNDSVKLFSNSILWDNHYKLITSNDSVMFTSSDKDTMYGIGFESDMDLTKWKIKKPRGIKNND